MEHYRSVFVTSAALVFGLVAASHIAYPRGPEADRPRVSVSEPASIPEAGASAWIDPPAELQGVTALGALTQQPNAEPKPAAFTQIGKETAALFSAGSLAEAWPASPRPNSAIAIRTHRAVRRATSIRTAAAMPAPQATPTMSAQGLSQAPEPDDKRVDLIGNLLKGLGIGHEG